MKWTVLKLTNRAATILSEKGSETPRLDAELLMCHLLKWENRVKIYTEHNRPISPKEVENYRQLIIRRAKGEPVAYITGKKEFFGFSFKVTKNVLIPRPETELLVEKTVSLIKKSNRQHPLKIADVGTGSGCIIITIGKLSQRPAKLFATDISEKALTIARENAKIHNIDISFIKTDLLTDLEENFSLIVSNPPYIPFKDERVDLNVTKYEPKTALYGGKKGTEIIEKLIKQSFKRLVEDGYLLIEIGDGQAQQVKETFNSTGFKNIETIKDLSRKERIVIGVKKCTSS